MISIDDLNGFLFFSKIPGSSPLTQLFKRRLRWNFVICVGCGPIKEIDNGKIEGDSITIGSEAAVVCNVGYDATLPTVTCQVTGLWETASCLPKGK